MSNTAPLNTSAIDVSAWVPATVPSEVDPVNRPMCRVLHVINGEHYSGAERVQDLLAAELPRFGFEVAFACLKPDRFPNSRQTHDATLHLTPMRGRFDWHCAQSLTAIIREENYALVHAHTPRSVLVGSIAARRTGVPLVYHVHSPTACDSTRRWHNWLNARLEQWSLRDAARLIAVSPSLRSRMSDSQKRPVIYVANGVPRIDAHPRSRPRQTWTLGMAALFRPRKGVEVLIESLSALRSQGIDVRLRAVGPFETPEYEREVLDLVDRRNLADAITWTGFSEDISSELAQIDLFVLPSLFGEGLPMVVLEAMAAAVPVVASHVEGIPEAIRHREEGLLVEAGSVSQLTLAISQLIAGKDGLDYEAMSANAQQRHAACFSAQAMAAGVAKIYREILDC